MGFRLSWTQVSLHTFLTLVVSLSIGCTPKPTVLHGKVEVGEGFDFIPGKSNKLDGRLLPTKVTAVAAYPDISRVRLLFMPKSHALYPIVVAGSIGGFVLKDLDAAQLAEASLGPDGAFSVEVPKSFGRGALVIHTYMKDKRHCQEVEVVEQEDIGKELQLYVSPGARCWTP